MAADTRKLGPYTAGRAYLGDFRALCDRLPAESVSLIFTDPPYLREHVGLYGDLACVAARILKPGGFLLTMAGGLYQDQHLTAMSAHLRHFWTFHVYLSGQYTSSVHPGGNPTPIITRVKPIYAYVKGWGSPRTVVYDPFAGDGNDKRFHHWGQDMKSARYFIDCFSQPGDVVLDPMCGGGTTAVVCKHLRRRWLAFDVDPAAVRETRARVANPFYVPSTPAGQLALAFCAGESVSAPLGGSSG